MNFLIKNRKLGHLVIYLYKGGNDKNAEPLFRISNIERGLNLELDKTTALLVAILAIVEFLIIIFLLFRQWREIKPLKQETIDKKEFDDVKYLYERSKDAAKKFKMENARLKEKINSLESTVEQLQKGNIELLRQRDRLLATNVQLEELQKQKDEYFAITMHDLKNPAGAIKGLLELLEDYDSNATEHQEIMNSIVSSSDHILKLAQRISEIVVATAEIGKLNLKMESVKSIIDVVCDMNAAYAHKKKIKLVNKSSIGTPKTLLDTDRIEEAIDNLINNAIKYGPEGTVVQVRTYFSSEYITVEVNDDGAGLTGEDLKKIFTKGAVLSTEPTAGEGRSGLGLWAVKKIVDEHNGNIMVDSKKGVGSTFSIELPIIKSTDV